jgi:hypothetical protein
MLRLSSHSKVPPGDFWYEQYFEADGHRLRKRWGPTPEIGGLAAKVSTFRKGNGLARADIVSSLEDVDAFTVARLPSDSKWVQNTDTPWDQLVAAWHGPGCRTCGGTAVNQ